MKSPKIKGIGEVATEYGAKVMKVIKKGLLGRSLFDFYGDVKANALRLKESSSAPLTPNDKDGGVVYVKNSDGKLYYKSNEVSEVELSSHTGLSTEEVQDIAGALVATGGTKTGISVVYQDGTGDVDFVVDHDAATNFTADEHFTQSSITTVGTIGTGVWEGTTIKTAFIGDDQVTEDKLADTLLAEIDANTLKISASGALTGVTSIENTSLTVGRDSDNFIDFSTDNVTKFVVDSANKLALDTTALYPPASNIALGSGSKQWTDLFLGDGGVINFNNGNITLTHTNNELTLTGDILNLTRVGKDASRYIDFYTAGEIVFRGSGVAAVKLTSAALRPVVDGGAALGSPSESWNDLFLDSGAKIEFDGGDVKIQHSSNVLTISGGTLASDVTGDVTGNADTATALTSGDKTINGDLTVSDTLIVGDIDLTSVAGQSLTITAGDYDNPLSIVGGDSKVFTRYQDNGTAGTNLIAIGALGDDSYFRNDEGSFKFYVANDATVGAEINQSGDLMLTGDIELGHASDTTIARSGAGTVTIEGKEIQFQGVNTGQYIEYPIRVFDSYSFYIYNDDYWYTLGTTSMALLGSSTAPGNLSSSSSKYQSRVGTYTALEACTLKKLTFTFYWSSSVVNSADIDFGFSKFTPITDGTPATITMNAITATDHNGTYTENAPYQVEFTFSGGNATFAAGDAFAFHMRTTGGSSGQRVIVYGGAVLSIELN